MLYAVGVGALSFQILAALDPRIHVIPALPADSDAQRTARVRQFVSDLSQPSTQVPVTAGFLHRLDLLRAITRHGNPEITAFYACDDVRNSGLIRLGAKLATECHYRLKIGPRELPISVWFSSEDKIADLRPSY